MMKGKLSPLHFGAAGGPERAEPEDSSGGETEDSEDWREDGEQLGSASVKNSDLMKIHRGESRSTGRESPSQQGTVHEGGHRGAPEAPPIKEEQEEVWMGQEDALKFTFTSVSLKSEDDGGRPGLDPKEVKTETTCGSDDSVDSDFWTETRRRRPDVPSPKNSEKKPRKLHGCSVCGKTFEMKGNLIQHMRIHTGEKPFSCSQCGRRFNQKASLTKHMLVHTKERPFCCSHCGKRFNHKSSLARHTAFHRGEKLVQCKSCDERFFWHYQLQKHKCVKASAKPN